MILNLNMQQVFAERQWAAFVHAFVEILFDFYHFVK